MLPTSVAVEVHNDIAARQVRMVPTPPRSVRTVVTALRMAEWIIPSPDKVVPDPRMAERINPSPNMIMTDPRTAEKVCMGPKKVAMGPRIMRMVAMCPLSTTPDTSSIQFCA